jgi:hypothetical protein
LAGWRQHGIRGCLWYVALDQSRCQLHQTVQRDAGRRDRIRHGRPWGKLSHHLYQRADWQCARHLRFDQRGRHLAADQ